LSTDISENVNCQVPGAEIGHEEWMAL